MSFHNFRLLSTTINKWESELVISSTIPHLILFSSYLVLLMAWWHHCLPLFTSSCIRTLGIVSYLTFNIHSCLLRTLAVWSLATVAHNSLGLFSYIPHTYCITDHSINLNEAKGIKAILTEHGLLPSKSVRQVWEEVQVQIQCMLQQTDPGASTRLHRTKISCSRNYWSCRTLVPFLAKIPLWTEPHWILLENGEKISLWPLQLLIQQVKGKLAKSVGFGSHTNHSSVGTLVISLGGCILGRTRVGWGSISSEEI